MTARGEALQTRNIRKVLHKREVGKKSRMCWSEKKRLRRILCLNSASWPKKRVGFEDMMETVIQVRVEIVIQ